MTSSKIDKHFAKHNYIYQTTTTTTFVFALAAGMHGFVDVKKCDGFEAPQRIITAKQRRQSREWIYYIAAEEIVWDYTPNMPEHIDE